MKSFSQGRPLPPRSKRTNEEELWAEFGNTIWDNENHREYVKKIIIAALSNHVTPTYNEVVDLTFLKACAEVAARLFFMGFKVGAKIGVREDHKIRIIVPGMTKN